MCGIAGFLGSPGAGSFQELVAIARRMGDRLVHRGPDAGDVWADASARVALAHRRLSIIDLSPAGAQPMRSADGRWTISFNGEIYNYPDLRAELEAAGVRFRGHSDTEVLIEAVGVWGLERALERANGMFALALWDSHARRLHLARDRIGEKPLYYGRTRDGWAFGSELKSLRAHPGFAATLDRDALASYFRYGYLPAPASIYRDTWKVLPGGVVTLSHDEAPRERTYWSAAEVYAQGAREPFRGSAEEATERLLELLRDSVKIRLHSDVPLGAFLSGGIDSTTVVAVMQEQASRPVQTFTIGFQDQQFDEARFAKEVARHLGTDHAELYLTGQDALAVVPRLPEMYDEPFADSSQIPTYLVSEFARRHVTVSLSGDGGDELFSGYSRYALAESAWNVVRRVPRPLRASMAKALGAIPAGPWDGLMSAMGPLLPAPVSRLGTASRRRQIGDLLASDSRQMFYQQLVSTWRRPAALVLEAQERKSTLWTTMPRHLDGYGAEMSYLDLVTYLPDDILVKVDRASMAVSLEARVPMLDPRLVALAASLPRDLLVRESRRKWILRQVLARYVPPLLFERPKMGFGVPLASWLRGPLRTWAQDLLSPAALEKDGILDARPVTALLQAHLAEREDAHVHLWSVLAFQAWLGAQRESVA